jgi:hypothetical protein
MRVSWVGMAVKIKRDTVHKYIAPGALASLVLPAAGLPEVGHRGELGIDGPPAKPAQRKTTTDLG